jgi:hypothetical protein
MSASVPSLPRRNDRSNKPGAAARGARASYGDFVVDEWFSGASGAACRAHRGGSGSRGADEGGDVRSTRLGREVGEWGNGSSSVRLHAAHGWSRERGRGVVRSGEAQRGQRRTSRPRSI